MGTFGSSLKTRTHNKLGLAVQYLKGLFQSKKGNIERMCERVVDSEYNRIHHFISESPWEARYVFNQVATIASDMFSCYERVGLLIDESCHVKKGTESVGVNRQYCCTTGKIDNCQVGVYAALSSDKYYGLIDTELFLPQSWTDDKNRCRQAGVPKDRMKHKSKRELALDIIRRQKAAGTRFDWVGADAGYGNDYGFLQQLDEMGQLFVIDMHSDQHVYTEAPAISVPAPSGNPGRKPTRYKTDAEPIEIKELAAQTCKASWQHITIRASTKGYLKCTALVQKVYTWDRYSASYDERLLIVRRTKNSDGSLEIKYSFSNAQPGTYTTEELVLMQSQRYFIERAFQEVKQDAAMSEYQVRGWRAWHHHMALVMMAQQFILSEKILYAQEMPLLSAYDVREIMLSVYPRKGMSHQEVMEQINKRHKQRREDIQRRLKT